MEEKVKFHFQGCQRGLSNHSGEEFSFFPFVFLYFLQAKGFHRSSHWSEVARGRKSQFWLHYPVSLPLQLNTKRNATHTPERIHAKGLLQEGRFEAGASNLNIKRCRAGGAELEPLLPMQLPKVAEGATSKKKTFISPCHLDFFSIVW